MRRQAAQDFTFSNGLTIPRGVTVAVASGPMQRDCVSHPKCVVHVDELLY